jgi:uncharacterized membrane protein YecN with MAPEG domain
MITALYAALSALLIVRLSLAVIKLRRQHRVGTGDGGHEDLLLAIRTQANTTEYIPITLILLGLLELNGAPALMLHAGGIALLTGRIIHAIGLPRNDLHKRALGMQITLYLIIALALLNIAYLPYDKLTGV